MRSGDTLWGIGQKFGVNYPVIAKINNIPNPNLIYPGKVLRIP
jgi:nucleoid-associated protein YgaU